MESEHCGTVIGVVRQLQRSTFGHAKFCADGAVSDATSSSAIEFVDAVQRRSSVPTGCGIRLLHGVCRSTTISCGGSATCPLRHCRIQDRLVDGRTAAAAHRKTTRPKTRYERIA
ncbi:MAG: hypothetical protein ACREQ5_05845 [Candidatus Dormibacteria bacterium]